jgi:hypothetical protein
MKSKYKLIKENDKSKWDDFIKSTKYSTIFQYSDYLDAVGSKYSCYFVYKASELRAAISVIESEDGVDIVGNDLVIHNGIAFGEPTTGQNHAQVISEHFNITEFIAEKLHQKYRNINITLSPSTIDIRPFLWVNYNTPLPQYKINVRYTSIIDISKLCDTTSLEDNEIYQRSLKVRRQSIRYSIRDKVSTIEEFNIDAFYNLYMSTMLRQGESPSNIRKMKELVLSLYDKNLLRMFVSRNADHEIGSIACFAIDYNRAYYLFGANNPEMRNQHTGTSVLWESFLVLSNSGVTEVDLEGVNSPKRGWFKLSFGGELLPYYNVTLENNITKP